MSAKGRREHKEKNDKLLKLCASLWFSLCALVVKILKG